MSMHSIATDRVVQNVIKIGGLISVLAIIAIITGMVTANGEVNFFTQAGVFMLVVWAISLIVALILAAAKRT